MDLPTTFFRATLFRWWSACCSVTSVSPSLAVGAAENKLKKYKLHPKSHLHVNTSKILFRMVSRFISQKGKQVFGDGHKRQHTVTNSTYSGQSHHPKSTLQCCPGGHEISTGWPLAHWKKRVQSVGCGRWTGGLGLPGGQSLVTPSSHCATSGQSQRFRDAAQCCPGGQAWGNASPPRQVKNRLQFSWLRWIGGFTGAFGGHLLSGSPGPRVCEYVNARKAATAIKTKYFIVPLLRTNKDWTLSGVHVCF